MDDILSWTPQSIISSGFWAPDYTFFITLLFSMTLGFILGRFVLRPAIKILEEEEDRPFKDKIEEAEKSGCETLMLLAKGEMMLHEIDRALPKARGMLCISKASRAWRSECVSKLESNAAVLRESISALKMARRAQ